MTAQAHSLRAPARFPSSLDRAMASGRWPVYIPADDLWLVESSTRAELDHIVQVFLDGTMSCTCEAGQHGQPDCLHRAGVGYCILHGVRGALHYCANCHSTRVARAGAHCIGCTQLIALAAEPVREPLPFPTERIQQVAPAPVLDWQPPTRQERLDRAPAHFKPAADDRYNCRYCGRDSRHPMHDVFC